MENGDVHTRPKFFKVALSADFLQNLSEKRASRNYKTQLFFSECARRSG